MIISINGGKNALKNSTSFHQKNYQQIKYREHTLAGVNAIYKQTHN